MIELLDFSSQYAGDDQDKGIGCKAKEQQLPADKSDICESHEHPDYLYRQRDMLFQKIALNPSQVALYNGGGILRLGPGHFNM